MRIREALLGVDRLFLDTAPVIYLVEQNPQFFDEVRAVFEAVDRAQIRVVASPVTLAECLVGAYRANQMQVATNFTQYLTQKDTDFVQTTAAIADRAAQLRSQYNLQMTDALQVATSIEAKCDAFLTNDVQLQRVTGIRVLIVGDLQI